MLLVLLALPEAALARWPGPLPPVPGPFPGPVVRDHGGGRDYGDRDRHRRDDSWRESDHHRRDYPRGYYRPHRGSRVRFLPLGFTVVVLGGVSYYYYDDVYYQQVPDGYLVVAPPEGAVVNTPPPTQERYVSVTAAALNVRSGPGYDFPVIWVVNQGAGLPVYGSSGQWLRVRLANGSFGWVDGQYTATPANQG